MLNSIGQSQIVTSPSHSEPGSDRVEADGRHVESVHNREMGLHIDVVWIDCISIFSCLMSAPSTCSGAHQVEGFHTPFAAQAGR